MSDKQGVYVQSLKYKKMSIGDAILLLQYHVGRFEFVTMQVSNKPYKQWLKEQATDAE